MCFRKHKDEWIFKDGVQNYISLQVACWNFFLVQGFKQHCEPGLKKGSRLLLSYR